MTQYNWFFISSLYLYLSHFSSFSFPFFLPCAPDRVGYFDMLTKFSGVTSISSPLPHREQAATNQPEGKEGSSFVAILSGHCFPFAELIVKMSFDTITLKVNFFSICLYFLMGQTTLTNNSITNFILHCKVTMVSLDKWLQGVVILILEF